MLLCSLWGSCWRKGGCSRWGIDLPRRLVRASGGAGLGVCEDHLSALLYQLLPPHGADLRGAAVPNLLPKTLSLQHFCLIQPLVVHNPLEFGVDGEREGWCLTFVISALLLVVQVQALFSPAQNQSRTRTMVLDFWV